METLNLPQLITTWLSVATVLWWAGLYVAYLYRKAEAEDLKEIEATQKKLILDEELAVKLKQKEELAMLRRKGVSPNKRRMQVLGATSQPIQRGHQQVPFGFNAHGQPKYDPTRLVNESKISGYGHFYETMLPRPRPGSGNLLPSPAGRHERKKPSKSPSGPSFDDFFAAPLATEAGGDEHSVSEPKSVNSHPQRGGTPNEAKIRGARQLETVEVVPVEMVPNEAKLPANHRRGVEPNQPSNEFGKANFVASSSVDGSLAGSLYQTTVEPSLISDLSRSNSHHGSISVGDHTLGTVGTLRNPSVRPPGKDDESDGGTLHMEAMAVEPVADVPVVVDVPVDDVPTPANEEPDLATVDGGISIADKPDQATLNNDEPDLATINDDGPDQATFDGGLNDERDQATFDGNLDDERDQATLDDDMATFYDDEDGGSRTLSRRPSDVSDLTSLGHGHTTGRAPGQ